MSVESLDRIQEALEAHVRELDEGGSLIVNAIVVYETLSNDGDGDYYRIRYSTTTANTSLSSAVGLLVEGLDAVQNASTPDTGDDDDD